MGAAAGLSTLLYLPEGGFCDRRRHCRRFGLRLSGGNENAAKSIWTTSMYGTYIITPDHLRGDRPIRFLGVPEPDSPATAIAPLEPAPVEPVH